jgi:hypothetical protein
MFSNEMHTCQYRAETHFPAGTGGFSQCHGIRPAPNDYRPQRQKESPRRTSAGIGIGKADKPAKKKLVEETTRIDEQLAT